MSTQEEDEKEIPIKKEKEEINEMEEVFIKQEPIDPIPNEKETNNFSIIKGIDGGEPFLCVLPSSWVVKDCFPNDNDPQFLGNDMFYWPLRAFDYLLKEAEKNPALRPEPSKCKADRCKIQRQGFRTKEEANIALQDMELNFETNGDSKSSKRKLDVSEINQMEKKRIPQVILVNQNPLIKKPETSNITVKTIPSLNGQGTGNGGHAIPSYSLIPNEKFQKMQEEILTLKNQVGNLDNKINSIFELLTQMDAKLDVIQNQNVS